MGDLKIKGSVDEDGVTTSLGEVSKQLKQAEIDILDKNGLIRDMGEVEEEIGKKWDTLTRNMQVALAQALGGKRQYTQVMALFDNWEKYEETLKESVNAQGELNAQQKIYLDSWDAASKRTKAIKEDITMDLVDDNAVIALINGFNILLQGVDDFIEGIGGLQGVLSILLAFVVNKFSKQMIASWQSIKANAMIMFGGSDKAAQAQTKQWQDALTQAKSRTAPGSIEEAQLNSIDAKIKAQQKIAKEGQFLTETEKEILELEFKQVEEKRAQAIQEQTKVRLALQEEQSSLNRLEVEGKITDEQRKRLNQIDLELNLLREQGIATEEFYQKKQEQLAENAVKPTRQRQEERLAEIEKNLLPEKEKSFKQFDSKSKDLSRRIAQAERDGATLPRSLDVAINEAGKDFVSKQSFSKKGSLLNVEEDLLAGYSPEEFMQVASPDEIASYKEIQKIKKKATRQYNRQKARAEGLPQLQEEKEISDLGAKNAEAQIKNLNAEAETLKKNLNTITSPQLTGEQVFQGFTNGLMGVSLAMSSVNGLMQTFKDGFDVADINDWTSAISSASMALMGFSMVKKAYTDLQITASVRAGMEAAAAAKLAKAKGEETVATNLNTVAKIANWVASHPLIAGGIALGVAITGATAYLIHHTDALNKANKEYDEHAEKLKEIKEKYDEEKRLLEEKKQKLEEINDIESSEAKQLQKSIKLQEHYLQVLEKQKETEAKLTSNAAKEAIEVRRDKSGDKNIDESLKRFTSDNERVAFNIGDSPIEMTNTEGNIKDSKKNVEELQKYMESEDFKKYVEQVNNLEEGEFKDQEMQKIIQFNEELLKAMELKDIYEKHGNDPKVLKEQLDIYNEELKAEKRWVDESAKIMEEYGSNVDAATKAIDNIQSSFKTLNEAMYEYNQNGSLSLDTFQTLITMEPKYLGMLSVENGQLKLNTDSMHTQLQVQKENLIMQQARAVLNKVSEESEKGLSSAIEYLTLATDEHSGSLEENIKLLAQSKYEEIENKLAADGLTEAEKEELAVLKEKINARMEEYAALGNVTLGLESSTKEVKNATKTLKEAQEALATFYLKKAFDENKREIEKYAKFIENIDLAINYSGLEDKQAVDAEKAKMVEMRKQLALTRVEFEKLSKMTPETASEAEEVSSRLEEYGESIKELTNNIRESERELENLKWTAATEAFDRQLEQINELNDASTKMLESFNDYGAFSDIRKRNAAMRLSLAGAVSQDADKNSLEQKKKDYDEYLEMTKDIDKQVNKAHEHALKLSNEKEEESLKERVKDAQDSFNKITKAHADAIEQQNKKTQAQLEYNKRTLDEWVQYCKDNPGVVEFHLEGPHAPDVKAGSELGTSFANAYTERKAAIRRGADGVRKNHGKTMSLASDSATKNFLNDYDFWLPLNKKSAEEAFYRGGDFGESRGDYQHQGEDLPAKEGEPIYAVRPGEVVVNSFQKKGAGNYIAIKDEESGQTFVYMHMKDQSSLKVGDKVYGGQTIGKVGTTGGDYDPHLHIEVFDGSMSNKGNFYDPQLILGHTLRKFNTASKGRTLTRAENVMVAEKGRELIWLEDEQKAFLVENQSFVNLPAGAHIYSNEETEKFLKQDANNFKGATINKKPLTSAKSDILNFASNGLNSLIAQQRAQYKDLRVNPDKYSQEELAKIAIKQTNDQVWEMGQIVQRLSNFMETEAFQNLTQAEQDAYVEALNNALDEEEKLTEEHRENIEFYANSRWEAADRYIEKMNKFGLWQENNDSYVKAEIRLYNDLIAKTEDLTELDRIRAESWERIQSAMEHQLSTVQEIGSLLTYDYEQQIKRIDATYTLTEKHYDMVNKLSEAQHSAEMSLYSSLQNARWLDAKTRDLIYNMDDYIAQTEQIAQIKADEQELFTQYAEDINSLSDDELWKAEFITAEYEKQLKIKEDEMTLLSLELDLTKKKEALNNTLMERNVRVYSGGRWQHIANQGNVQKAMTDFSEAQFKYDQQQTKMEQQAVLRDIEYGKTELEIQIAEINAKIEALNHAWEEEIAQLKYGTISLDSFNGAVDDAFDAIKAAIRTLDDIKYDVSGGSSNKSKSYGSDNRVSYFNDRYAGLSGKALGDALVADIVKNRVLSKVTGSTIERYQKNAKGSASTKGGWSQVNEKGVEMYATRDGQFIELSPYEKIFNNEQFEFLYNLSKAGTENVSSMMKNYSTSNSALNIENMSLALPNVTDTDSFVEGLKGLKDYIKNTMTINS